jgi:tubulin beta
MSEIITIHIGHCGITLGAKFWETLCHEHGIDPNGTYDGDSDQQLERINVFFNKATGGRYIPRAVLVDLEPNALDTLRAGVYGKMFRLDNFIFGQSGAGNIWAKGYHTEGAELIDSLFNVIRREAEECSDLQGFIVVHSVGSGTGGGMGSLLIESLRKEYPDQIIATFSVFPSYKVSDTAIAPYNAVLSTAKLILHTDLVFCLDNEASYDIAFNSQKITTPSYADLNAIIADAMSGITAPLRFPSQDTNDFATLQAMVNSFVPSENRDLHFLTVGLSPLRCDQAEQPDPLTTSDAFNQVIQPGNMLVSSRSCGESLAAASIAFRGEATMKEIQDYISTLKLKGDAVIPDNLMALKFDIPLTGLQMAATLIKNDSCVQEMFKRISDHFTVAFRSKKFLHWYTIEGMDEMEFTEAESSLNVLISEYPRMQASFPTIKETLEQLEPEEEEYED